MQENVLKQQADPENGSGSDHSSDSSNSSSSSFGCQSQDEEEKPRKKKKKQPAKAKAAPKDMAKPKAQPRKTEKAKDRLEKEKSNKALAKEASILDGAAKLLTLLEDLTCPAIWRSAVRSTEVDRRIGRATPTCSEIENVLTEIQGEDVEARKGKLLEIRNRLNKKLKDLCKIIRNSSAEELIEEVSAAGTIKHHFEACWASVFDADGTLAEMVRMISKNIADVSWLVAGHETMD